MHKEKGMFRRLHATEIAEGALLADVAVIFQLTATYIPIGGDFFRGLILIVFTVLTLRRDLYVGMMGLLVASFLISVMIGPQYIITTAIEAMAGIFLGFTMRHHFSHLLLLFLGISCGALTVFCLVLVSFLLSGLSVNSILQPLQDSYHAAIPIMGNVSAKLGLAAQWHSFYPFMNTLVNFLFTYWLLLIYLGLWIMIAPFVIVIYAFANFTVRQLGYDVRPFPGGLLNRIIQSSIRLFVVEARRHERFWLLRFLAKDVQRTYFLLKKSFKPFSTKKSYKS